MERHNLSPQFPPHADLETSLPELAPDPGYRQDELFIYVLAVLTSVTLLSTALVFISPRPGVVLFGVLAGLLIEAGAWILLRRGSTRSASTLLTIGLWFLFSAAMFTADIRGSAPWVLLLILTWTAGLLLGTRAAFWMAGSNAIIGLIVLLTTNADSGARLVLAYSPTGVWFLFVVGFFAAAGLAYIANFRITSAHRTAALAALSEAEHRRSLDALQASLADQVELQTAELEAQARRLQSVVTISREIGSILDTARLVETVVNRLSEEFDLYYTGFFRLDPTGEWAVLQAGTGEPGRQMVARGHRIRVGSGMIGWSIANGQLRVALDVGRDAVRLATSELPETRTEAAIPLRVRGKILGALSIQSSMPQAFDEIEIDALISLADQVAIAYDNALRHEEAVRAIEESNRVREQVGRRAWQEFLQASTTSNVRYSAGRLSSARPPEEAWMADARRQALETGRPVQAISPPDGSSARRSALFLPIPIRGAGVGMMMLTKEGGPELAASAPGEHRQNGAGSFEWLAEEISLLQNIVAQLGIALDSARLYEDTQRLAYREQLESEVTDRIRQSLDIQVVLRTAAEEIQRSLNLPDVAISLLPPEQMHNPTGAGTMQA